MTQELPHRLALFGSSGKVGTVLSEAIRPAVPINSRMYAPDLPEVLEGCDALVWAATSPWPHTGLWPFADDLQAFIEALHAAGEASIRRVVFFSSFNVDFERSGVTPDYYGDVPVKNYYRAGKIAGEAFCEAYAAADPLASVVCLRLGWFEPGAECERGDLRAIRVGEREVLGWTTRALAAPPGFHCWNAAGRWDG